MRSVCEGCPRSPHPALAYPVHHRPSRSCRRVSRGEKMRHLRLLALGAVLAAGARQARAQDSTSKAAPDTPAAAADTTKEEERSTGLPGQVKWKFNLDAGAGVF